MYMNLQEMISYVYTLYIEESLSLQSTVNVFFCLIELCILFSNFGENIYTKWYIVNGCINVAPLLIFSFFGGRGQQLRRISVKHGAIAGVIHTSI